MIEVKQDKGQESEGQVQDQRKTEDNNNKQEPSEQVQSKLRQLSEINKSISSSIKDLKKLKRRSQMSMSVKFEQSSNDETSNDEE